MLVPSIGLFFTPLHLEAAFAYQDEKRIISSRRFVAPSFNDVRLILNTAQIMTFTQPGTTTTRSHPDSSIVDEAGSGDADKNLPQPLVNPLSRSRLDLLTFDGDVTLYDDGASLDPENPVIPRLLRLLSLDVCIGIVTAAGYTDASKYYHRLWGLLDAVKDCPRLTRSQKHNLIIMGGESNYLFVFDDYQNDMDCDDNHTVSSSSSRGITNTTNLRYVRRRDWILPIMESWDEEYIRHLLDVSEAALINCIRTLRLPAQILRKERAVGIIPRREHRLTREQLEETVLVVQQRVDEWVATVPTTASERPQLPPFCAFNGGSDVFVDIGDKSLGVQGCQKWFGQQQQQQRSTAPGLTPGASNTIAVDTSTASNNSHSLGSIIKPESTLHVGDQFLSGGGNDFKARLACTTAWIAEPAETVALLDEMMERWGV